MVPSWNITWYPWIEASPCYSYPAMIFQLLVEYVWQWFYTRSDDQAVRWSVELMT